MSGRADSRLSLASTSPRLVNMLRQLGDDYGPRGVVLTVLALWPDAATDVRAPRLTQAVRWLTVGISVALMIALLLGLAVVIVWLLRVLVGS